MGSRQPASQNTRFVAACPVLHFAWLERGVERERLDFRLYFFSPNDIQGFGNFLAEPVLKVASLCIYTVNIATTTPWHLRKRESQKGRRKKTGEGA